MKPKLQENRSKISSKNLAKAALFAVLFSLSFAPVFDAGVTQAASPSVPVENSVNAPTTIFFSVTAVEEQSYQTEQSPLSENTIFSSNASVTNVSPSGRPVCLKQNLESMLTIQGGQSEDLNIDCSLVAVSRPAGQENIVVKAPSQMVKIVVRTQNSPKQNLDSQRLLTGNGTGDSPIVVQSAFQSLASEGRRAAISISFIKEKINANVFAGNAIDLAVLQVFRC